MDIILAVVGIALILDSLVVVLYPEWAIAVLKKWAKKGKKGLRKIGIWELIVGIIILLLGVLLRGS